MGSGIQNVLSIYTIPPVEYLKYIKMKKINNKKKEKAKNLKGKTAQCGVGVLGPNV